MATHQKRHWNREEVAEMLGIHPNTVSRHIKSGRLEASKPGQSYIITRSALVDYLGSEKQVNDIFGTRKENETNEQAGPAF